MPDLQPQDQATRLALAHEIAGRAHETCGSQLLAIGLYGSVAHGTDSPFSDLEMMCILSTSGEDRTYEWAYGGWKAEVNFMSQDLALRYAAELEGDWSRTHGSYAHTLALYDPTGFLPRLRATALDHNEQQFRDMIHAVIVGEIYELVGKLRNARLSHAHTSLPYLAFHLVEHGACLVGMANRHLYATGARLLEDSLSLSDQPPGYADLCRLAMGGMLDDPGKVFALCEGFWKGIETWAAEKRIDIEAAQKIPF